MEKSGSPQVYRSSRYLTSIFKDYRRLQHKICNVCQPMDFASEPKISTLCYQYPDQCSSEEDLKYGYCHALTENSTFCAFF